VEIKNAATMNGPANAARAAVRSDASRRARSEQATAIRWKVERVLTGWTGLPDGLLRSSCSLQRKIWRWGAEFENIRGTARKVYVTCAADFELNPEP
jgi:hypothetical protein